MKDKQWRKPCEARFWRALREVIYEEQERASHRKATKRTNH